MEATARQLREDNAALREELAWLKSELVKDSDIAPLMLRLNLTRASAIIAKSLSERQSISRASLAVFLWQDCPREMKSLDVMIHNARRKLLSFGIAIETIHGYGWRMAMQSKQRLRELLAR